LALTDPQSITIDGVTSTLPRTGSSLTAGAFRNSDGSVVMNVSHTYGKRTRRVVRIDHSKIAADPLTADNVRYSMSTYVVVDTPVDGYTVAEQQDVVDALVAFLAANSGAVVAQVLGGES